MPAFLRLASTTRGLWLSEPFIVFLLFRATGVQRNRLACVTLAPANRWE